MRRACCALAIVWSLLPLAAAAEEPSFPQPQPPVPPMAAENVDDAVALPLADFVTAGLSTGPASVDVPTVTTGMFQEPAEEAEAEDYSLGEYCDCGKRFVCGHQWCGPCICRFDYPVCCEPCVTDRYCDHWCLGHGNCRQTGEGDCPDWVCNGHETEVYCRRIYGPTQAVRFGWWGVDTSGSLVKIGEYQDLDSSPFWDIDGISTDGYQTYNYWATGNDNESTQLGLQYYKPGSKATVEFQRFLRRRDHDPFLNMTPEDQRIGPDILETPVLVDDLNVGEDYAIRVQTLKGTVQSRVNKNLKLRVDVWGIRKFGERQANGQAHCFNVGPPPLGGGNYCHVVSQRQQIDWQTFEITPRVEARLGKATIEYSRQMRTFDADDQGVTRPYTNPFGTPVFFPRAFSNAGNPEIANYAFVPDNYTEIDQLKMGADLSECTKFYGFAYTGRTKNEFRDVERRFGGYDLRLTNYSIDGLTLTAYTKLYDQDGEDAPFLIDTEFSGRPPLDQNEQEARGRLRSPVEYRWVTAGLKGRWRPLRCDPWFGKLAFTGGYEYRMLRRRNAVYESPDANFVFAQPHTITNSLFGGVRSALTSTIDGYVRYEANFIGDPLYGFRETNGAINSGQPEQQHIVKIGGSWLPTCNFMATGYVEMISSRHSADISQVPGNFIDFDEESYPIIGTFWYQPTCKLSFSGGVAYLTNWIDQNIILGDDYPEQDPVRTDPITRRWNYGGRSTVVSLNTAYCWTPCVTLVGGYEYVRGVNGFAAGPIADLWPDLPSYSRVVVETQRVNVGVDWKPYEYTTLYTRYILFDYDDKTKGFNSGTANMALAGMLWVR